MKGRQEGCSGRGNRQCMPSGHDRDLDFYRGKFGATRAALTWGRVTPAERCSAVSSAYREMDCPCNQDGSERCKRKGNLEDGVKTSESPSKQESDSQVCVRESDRYRRGQKRPLKSASISETL